MAQDTPHFRVLPSRKAVLERITLSRLRRVLHRDKSSDQKEMGTDHFGVQRHPQQAGPLRDHTCPPRSTLPQSLSPHWQPGEEGGCMEGAQGDSWQLPQSRKGLCSLHLGRGKAPRGKGQQPRGIRDVESPCVSRTHGDCGGLDDAPPKFRSAWNLQTWPSGKGVFADVILVS